MVKNLQSEVDMLVKFVIIAVVITAILVFAMIFPAIIIAGQCDREEEEENE